MMRHTVTPSDGDVSPKQKIMSPWQAAGKLPGVAGSVEEKPPAVRLKIIYSELAPYRAQRR